MIKKELEKKIKDLEREVAELKTAMLTLSLRQPIFVPSLPISPALPLNPIYPIPVNPTYPYIGDPIPGSPNYTIITCRTLTDSSKDENYRILN